MPTDPKTLPEKYTGYLADHGWVHVTRDHPRAAPPVGIFDAPVACCIELNQLWSSHVIGALGALVQPDAWTGDAEEIDRATQEIEKFVNRLVQPCEEDCGVYRLRQNPSNPCQLQQSVDGGTSWTLAFDFSLCQAVPTQTQVTNYYTTNVTQLQQIYQNFVNNYTDNITDLYPDLGYDATSEDDRRDQALCFAAGEFVRNVCEQAIRAWDELETSLNNVRVAIVIAAGIAALIGIVTTGGAASPALATLAGQAALWAAGLNLGAAVGEALYTQLVNSNRENYENLEARQEVVCCLYNALKGANVNLDVFKTALDGCTFTGDAEAIRQYALILLDQDVTYAAFAQTLDLAYRQARLDLLPVCPCADAIVRVYNDFARLTLKSEFAATFGVPFDITVDPATWGTNEFFAVWDECLTYHYEVITGTYTPTTGEAPWAYIDCTGTTIQPLGGTAATDLINDADAQGIFMNPNELDLTVHTVRITLTV
jgi:hypothetical protein